MNSQHSSPADEVQIKAAEELLRRRQIRSSLTLWAKECGFMPALHHQFLIKELEAVVRGEVDRLIICMPPGSAKSTYTSLLFPPWFLAQRPQGATILGCSYSYTLIEGFGRKARNLIAQKHKILGYDLKKDSKSAGEWETTNNGRFFSAGTGAGIAGHRADLAFIDDPIGTEVEANSKLERDKLWDWYRNDFVPRLKPRAARVVIANRRHEEDLVGRLLNDSDGSKWKLVNLPFVAEENDVLGRAKGDRLWPEWFTDEMVAEARKNPQTFAGLYQQRPSPEDGDFYKKDWLIGYQPNELPPLHHLRIYAGSDHAVSEKEKADFTAIPLGGMDSNGILWILPDLFWEQVDALKACNAMFDIGKKYRPINWWAERGHISKSIGPFLKKKMHEESCYFNIEEVTSSHDKQTRAQSFKARCQEGKVRFPVFAPWWSKGLLEMLTFPNGKHDDLVDAFSEIGQGLDQITKPNPPPPPAEDWTGNSDRGMIITLKDLKANDMAIRNEEKMALLDR